MNQYDREARLLERRRQLAEALRASGNEALPASLQTGGRFDAPVSGWQYANKALQQILGGVEEHQISKAEKELTTRQEKAQADWMSGLAEAQKPSELQPQAPTGQLMMPGGEKPMDAIKALDLDPTAAIGAREPVGLQEQMARRVKGQALRGDVQQQVDAGDRQKLLAHYMKGGEVGGVPQAIGMAGLQRELLPPVKEDFTLGRGDTRFSGQGKKVATGEPYVDAEARQLVDIVDPNSPEGYRTILESDWKGEQRYHRPDAGTTIKLPPLENAYDKTKGENLAKTSTDIQDAGRTAGTKISKYQRMGQLLEGVNTGKLTPTFAQVSAIGESLGIKLDESLGDKQALEALSNEIALTLRNPTGGAGMPGALSDKDREFLVSMTPGLGKTPEGNRLIIETAIKLAQRDQDVAKLAREYEKAHGGRLDDGFYDELAAHSAKNPLFGTYTGGAPPAAAPVSGYEDPNEEAAYQEWKSQQK